MKEIIQKYILISIDKFQNTLYKLTPHKSFDMKKAQHTANWFNYSQFYDFISKRQSYKVFVEVGVWKGHSVSYLANKLRKRKGIKIYAVDLFDKVSLFKGTRFENDAKNMYKIYNANLMETNTRKLISDIKGYSHLAAKKFKDASVDFVFLDADHRYESVLKDIKAWLPKIKKGGIISGHDFNQPAGGVKKAVYGTFPRQKVRHYKGNAWYVEIK